MHRERHRAARVDRRDLFDRERVGNVSGVDAAVCFGDEDAHDAGAIERGKHLARKGVLAIPLRDVRSDLALRDLRGKVGDLPLFFGKIELSTCSGVDQTFTSNASPWPPPEQIEAIPYPPPRLRNWWISVPTMRAPDAPIGCPNATAPPC